MYKKTIQRQILVKLVRDNNLHKILSNKFGFTEKRVEQWFYRALKDENQFSKVYNHFVVLELIKYLEIAVDELFDE